MKVRKKRKPPQRQVGQQLELIKLEESARQRLEEFLDHKMVHTSNRRRTTLERSIKDAERRSKIGDWTNSNGRTFVGLYGLCYRIVYGRLPIDMDNNGEFVQAANMANSLFHKYFDDNADDFVEFIKWTWEREKKRIIRALNQGHDRQRIIARYQFSKSFVEDYRVHLSNRNRYVRHR